MSARARLQAAGRGCLRLALVACVHLYLPAGCGPGAPGRPPGAAGVCPTPAPKGAGHCSPGAGGPGRGRSARGEVDEGRADLYLQSQLSKANDLYLAGEFSRASDLLRRLRHLHAERASSPWATYVAARCELVLGRLGSARELFEGAAAKAAGSRSDGRDLEAHALSGLADVSLAQRRPAEALGYIARIREGGLEGHLAPHELLFREAAAFEALSRREAAARAYGRVAALWPDCSLAAESRSRSEALRLSPAGGATPEAGYSALAGEFEERASADAVARRLRETGFDASVRTVAREGRTRFVVWLGSYAEREEAEDAARRTRDAGYPSEVRP